MRIYLELARLAFQQQFAYRAATLAGLFTNSIFGIMLTSVYLGLYASRADGASVEGFTSADTTTYVWIGQALIMPVYIWGWWEIIATIRTGAVVMDMLRPTDYFAYWLSRDAGRAVAHILLRFVPTIAIGAALFDISFPATAARSVAFLASMLLAVLLSFCVRFMFNLWGFWILDHRGIAGFSMVMIGALSGHLLPLAWYPDTIRAVLNALPFRGMIMTPIEIWLGQVSIVAGLGLQIAWSVVLIAASYGLLGVAERKVVVQGG